MTGEAGRRGLGLDVVHTGQHYDYELSRVFLLHFVVDRAFLYSFFNNDQLQNALVLDNM